MPRPKRATRDETRVCVMHSRRCRWAGGDLHESTRECREATPTDREKGVGIFAVPAPPFALDDAVVRLIAELDGNDPDEAVEAYHRELTQQVERDLAEWRRRDRQTWEAWLVEELSMVVLTAEQMNQLVARLADEVEKRSTDG